MQLVSDTPPEQTRTWRPPSPVDVRATLAVHQRGRHDPTHRVAADGSVWRTCRTPDGPATLHLASPGARAVEAAAWGPGSSWVLDRLPEWLGACDRPEDLVPRHRLISDVVRRNPGLRIGRTGLVMEALVPAVLEQKVTGMEASRGWRALVRAHGEPAPGPAPDGMRVMPSADALRMMPSWSWQRAGVGPDRARTVVQAARVARRLAEAAAMSPADAVARLRAVPGIGPWTAAEVVQRALGDPDTVSVGDFSLPRIVAYALAGERTADDVRMLELLEPYRGQRYRACLLLLRSGRLPPRRAPRQPVRDFRRM